MRLRAVIKVRKAAKAQAELAAMCAASARARTSQFLGHYDWQPGEPEGLMHLIYESYLDIAMHKFGKTGKTPRS